VSGGGTAWGEPLGGAVHHAECVARTGSDEDLRAGGRVSAKRAYAVLTGQVVGHRFGCGGLLGYGGPAQATFAGPNGRIAYSVDPIFPQEPVAPSPVFTINPDGSGRRQLTHVAGDQTAGSPAWSPDGTRIVYVSNARGDLELWVMAADGSGQHPLASDPGFAHFQPSWSPDGRRIVFSDNCCLPFSNLWDMRADGGGKRQLTHLGDPEQAFFGAYSPNGRRLATYAELGPSPDALTAGLYTLPAGGGSLVPVFTIDQLDVILFDWGPAR
jgi:Tol biopolymer transport system component